MSSRIRDVNPVKIIITTLIVLGVIGAVIFAFELIMFLLRSTATPWDLIIFTTNQLLYALGLDRRTVNT